jgi:Protein of unknown function (DUF3759)
VLNIGSYILVEGSIGEGYKARLPSCCSFYSISSSQTHYNFKILQSTTLTPTTFLYIVQLIQFHNVGYATRLLTSLRSVSKLTPLGEAHEQYQEVYENDQPHEAKFSHEAIAGAGAFAAFKTFEDHQRKEGKLSSQSSSEELSIAHRTNLSPQFQASR